MQCVVLFACVSGPPGHNLQRPQRVPSRWGHFSFSIARPPWPRFNDATPVLTRRRNLEASDECRQIYFGDVRVGTIVIRTGNPHDTDPWEWWCGFYPGSHPREHQSGTAATFDQARADFEAAWRVFLSNRTEADFQVWRDERDSTARKYALWDAGNGVPANEWEPGKPCDIFEMPMRRDFQQSAARGNRHSRPPHHRCRNVALSRFAFLPPSPI